MKKLTLTSLIVFLTTFVYGQEIKISVAPTINNALYYKFVAGGPGRGFKSGLSTSVEYILRSEKRINLGFGLNYQFCRVEYDEILLNLEPKLWVHNIIPFSGFDLPQRLTVAGLNVGLVFGNKDD